MILLGALPGRAQPLIDYHQHLLSPFPRPNLARSQAVQRRRSDRSAGRSRVRRAVVLSLAYQHGNPNKPPVAQEHDRVKKKTTGRHARSRNIPSASSILRGGPLTAYALSESQDAPTIHTFANLRDVLQRIQNVPPKSMDYFL